MEKSKLHAWALKNKLCIDKSKYKGKVPPKAYIILVNHWCHKILLTIAQIAVIAMLIIVFFNVVLRFCFNSGIKWVEEVPGLLVTLFTFIAMAIGVRDHMHISVTILYNRFKKGGKARLVMDYLVDIASLFCGVILFYYGIKYISNLRPGSLPMTGFPTWIQYIPAPIGGFIMIFDSLLFLMRILSPEDLLYSEAEVDYAEMVKDQKKQIKEETK